MILARRLLTRTKPLIAATLAAAGLLAGSWQPAAAECNPPGADTSFRNAAPHADRIVVGRVVAVGPAASLGGDRSSYQFTLEVEQVLRGAGAPMLPVDHLETGGCVRWLSATRGDRIALALDVRRPDSTVAKNAAGWLSGTPSLERYETISMAELLALVQVTLPETSTAPADAAEGGAGHFAAGLGAAAAAGFLLGARRRTARARSAIQSKHG
jgi:hypothetical protein